ncbi:GntR family transcriptional regulator [Clostridium septicum]|uniref:GntR family transcriptional regulator n=1 Tax=Clostridium septicum TaxID=1504 RepID=A0A9N7JJI9_CLOSE|nr:GntR family transcriptional regulator [Clostridium septicum]AYE33734.1 GntR family transcriptional regulator [Clostridium septicum]MDU1315155.1 GntR family transcriptional regulator [Clostridium septicum]QAS61891.1 GntR family transcriptional regulator [Clostridium septicum]UEC21654.1 GntR family transcriptional regulator [Clostridium septicum]USS00296.1 GntR family transcriptional regulator [Clostridium septicum]
MVFNFNEDSPIYLQIANSIEDGILNGIYQEESQIPSTTEISITYKINPATVGKGFNILVNEGIIYKKRGVGMFVSTGAVKKLLTNRKNKFFDNYILTLMSEAKRLGITVDEIINMIKGGNYHE